MDDVTEVLRAARDAYGRREWIVAWDCYHAARAAGALSADDVAVMADVAWWLGFMDESLAAAEQAYRRYLEVDRRREAAMAAIGIAVTLFLRGDGVMGSGWMSRAQRLVADEPESPEHGYARYLVEVEAGLDGADLDAVIASAREVQALGRRCGDVNLVAAGTVGEGRALVRQGRTSEGMALLDEAMVAVLSDELSPDWAGNAYCHVMAACHELTDIRRAAAWTEATTRWLETLPPAVLFTGICRVHRSQVLQIAGAWEQAEHEAALVCEDLRDIAVAAAAEGHYQLGELRRLRGDLTGAQESYEHAHRRGRDPQPGMALLRLAEGRIDSARASISAALAAEPRDRLARSRLCAAQVEIAVAAGDPGSARRASEELDDITAVYAGPGLQASSRQARGSVLLAEGDTLEALATLRAACRLWQDLDAPYDAARVRVLLAEAYRALGDADAAALELDAAEAVFVRLGAPLDAARVAAARGPRALPGGLTEREAEVLACVAAGRTNREVAAMLFISEKTVARHLSNIFTKVGVPSRTAAAAYAYEHGLASRPRG